MRITYNDLFEAVSKNGTHNEVIELASGCKMFLDNADNMVKVQLDVGLQHSHVGHIAKINTIGAAEMYSDKGEYVLKKFSDEITLEDIKKAIPDDYVYIDMYIPISFYTAVYALIQLTVAEYKLSVK